MPIAAVLPAPPLAVPAVVGGPDPQTAELTAACLGVLAEVRRDGRPVLMVGVGAQTRVYPPGVWGSLAGLGVAVRAAPAGTVALQSVATLSVSLTVGCWLLAQAWPGAAASLREVAVDATAQQCATLGAEWARQHRDAVWVVLADGSTVRRSPVVDERSRRAGALDDAVAEALGAGDAAALSGLDGQQAADLGAAGRAAWQVLAGAVAGAPVEAEIRYAAAPFGVGYHVARWQW